jgi:hypothetical protein
VTTSIVNGETVATLTFVAGASVYRRGTGYCLVDGNYELTVFSDEVSYAGQHLDGNKDGVAGDDYSFGTTAADKFFRMFGDNDGDRDVDPTDFAFFRRTYGKVQGNTGFNAAFDYDGDGDVDLTDFAFFRRNWGKTLPLP